ncbi:hypothetical protein ASPACDRAFT_122587 [Aspergillus aculeatus ATCC 16872]|uniref:Flavin reductase like domain-containing protein n=1 Tax=Aspergillus aculeatus (strain ATCC 16872 / CBS 172.66 / WB 5094) TaxID=690307 RepID=A0A1L9WNX2_ASPA1|nr:uncharacterized protein ASPACDRAFT_122587 [Aspergillus aculeatus ATCC 16872]OJJ97875.1 hypothetical protein ASPACDRAFT_122587 [Aspergillus aculeatus ATCC 16872]
MLAAGRTAASSSLLRGLTPVLRPYSVPATPTTSTTSAKPSSHTIITSKRTCTTSPATHQQEQHQEEQEQQPSQTPLSTQPTQQDLSTQIRLLMRQVPYPVAIITSTDPHAHARTSASPSPSQPSSSSSPFRGMTVSSFNTVTLHPTPIISFNVRRPSETLTALQSSGRFLVHLLAPHPRTAALARDFSRGNRRLGILPAPETGDKPGEEEPGTAGYEFAALPPSPVESENVSSTNPNTKDAHPPPLPLLRRRNRSPGSAANPKDQEKVDDFPFVFECRVLPQSIQVQDHTIVVGRVVRAITRPKHAGEAAATMIDHQVQQDAKDLCLTYADTRFWEIGKEI